MNTLSYYLSSLPNENPPLARASPKFQRPTSIDMNAPLLRRDSTTEAVIFPNLVLEAAPDEDGSELSLISEPSLANQLLSRFNQLMENFTPANDDQQQIDYQSVVSANHAAIIMGQQGSERKKAKAVTRNREEFQKLKLQLREAGALTNYGTRAFLKPIVEDCAEELKKARKKKNKGAKSKMRAIGEQAKMAPKATAIV